MRFDLTDLSLFRHVVEAGSITHGAERAHLALAAASTRIRNMEQALGAPLLVAGAAGRHADPGRPHAAAARPHHAGAGRAAARGPRRLCGRARRPGPGAVQHQCAHRVPARGAELVPRRPSECQRRPRGAAERRDRRADRRRRRRHRHRGRHGRCRPADDLSVPQRPLRAGGGARPSAGAAAKIGFAEVLDHDFVGLDRASAHAALPRQQGEPASAGRCGCACSCAASTRSAGWSSATSASASCRRPPRGGRPRRWRSRRSNSTDPWALRELTICIRDFAALPPYARQLVEHMRRRRKLDRPTGCGFGKDMSTDLPAH